MSVRPLPGGPGYRRMEGETAVCGRYFPMIRRLTPSGQRLQGEPARHLLPDRRCLTECEDVESGRVSGQSVLSLYNLLNGPSAKGG